MYGSRVEEVQSDFGRIVALKDDLITRQIKKFGNHTRPEFAFATSVLDPGMSVFDIGAHIGTFALCARRKLRTGAPFLAVEGNAAIHALLRKNLGPDIFTMNSFVGAEQGLSYQEKEGNSGAGRLIRGPAFQRVRSVSIDNLADMFFEPDFIKLDVEGMEFSCLADCKLLRRARPILYLEVFAEHLATYDASPTDLDHLLSELGYHYFRNGGDRNARHDIFRAETVAGLTDLSGLTDVLCVPESSALLAPLQAACARGSDAAEGGAAQDAVA